MTFLSVCYGLTLLVLMAEEHPPSLVLKESLMHEGLRVKPAMRTMG